MVAATGGELSARIKQFREGKGWTREELAARLEVSRQQPWKWETGQGKPSRAALQRLRALGFEQESQPQLSALPSSGQSVSPDYMAGFLAGIEHGVRIALGAQSASKHSDS